MNYEKVYNDLIIRANNRLIEGYSENHHIIPKSFGGSNKDDNLVRLTAREHFIAHLLLYKMQTTKRRIHQMLTAVVVMSGKDKFNSRLYESAKKEFSILHSERISGKNSFWYGSNRIGELNPFYGKEHTAQTKQKISKASKDKVVAIDTISGKKVKISKEEFDSSNRYVGNTFGQNRDPDVNKRVSEKLKGIVPKKGKCIHCDVEMDKGNLTRYHNENCKLKKENNEKK
jgi:hypothetical protein